MPNRKPVNAGNGVLLLLVIANAVVVQTAFTTNPDWYAYLNLTLPLLLLAFWDRNHASRS